MATKRSRPQRRQPQQRRSQETVEVILLAVRRLLARHGAAALTTNRIAAEAGVSIGSLYQYFPNKEAIYRALHDRHVAEMETLIDATLAAHAEAPLSELLGALLDALVEAHRPHPELYALLDAEVAHGRAGALTLQPPLREALRLALAAHPRRAPAAKKLEATLFIAAQLIDALAHAIVLDRPKKLSLAAARAEAKRALSAYLCDTARR